MTCQLCEVPLTGGLDTFDDPQTPLCITCWMDMAHERPLITLQLYRSTLAVNHAYARNDWAAADAAYHNRFVGVVDSLMGLRLAK